METIKTNLLAPFRKNHLLNVIFLANIFFSFHYYLIYYLNSTFLSNFFSDAQVSTLFIVGSVFDLMLLLNASKILNKLGSYKFTTYAIISEALATVGLVVSTSHTAIAFYFLLHVVTISLLMFNLDVLVETESGGEDDTGSVRSTFLTIANIIVMLSPSIVALLLVKGQYWHVYTLSALFLIPLYLYIRNFKSVTRAPLPPIRIRETILAYLKNKDLYNIFGAQFLLQLFYAFMSIYTPLYLVQHIGFSWSEIGLIFTIMLLPFIFIEVPVGRLEDTKYGEKEFLTIGFVIMCISTICLSFITAKSFFIWAAILFITRIGASLVEISSDTYFFKQVNQEKTDIISFYRITRPLSFIVAPILATLAFQFLPFQYSFMFIGALMILGARYALGLKDTK